MVKDASLFYFLNENMKSSIKLENGEVVQARSRGAISVNTRWGIKVILNGLYILELYQNLLSIAQMMKNGYSFSFRDNDCIILDKYSFEIARVKITGNSFYLKLDIVDGHVYKAKADVSLL